MHIFSQYADIHKYTNIYIFNSPKLK